VSCTKKTYLTTRSLGIYAHSSYLSKFGTPQTLKDLDAHRLIIFLPNVDPLKEGKSSWLLEAGSLNGNERIPYMVVNSVECTAYAAGKGLGIIALSQDSLLIKDHNLVQILTDVKSPQTDMYYFYPDSLKTVQTIKTLEQYLVKVFQEKMDPL
jgi:hypothetical protein